MLHVVMTPAKQSLHLYTQCLQPQEVQAVRRNGAVEVIVA